MSPELARVLRTSWVINVGIWIVAVGLLAVSTINAGTALSAHGFPYASAWLLPLCVDLGVAIALVAGRVLADHGLRSKWGTALRWVAAIVGLVLNDIDPMLRHDLVGGLLHSLPTLLLLVVVESGASFLFILGRLRIALAAKHTATEPANGTPSKASSIDEPTLYTRPQLVRNVEPDRTQDLSAVGSELWQAGMAVRSEIDSEGGRLSRSELVRRLRARGHSIGTDRAGVLLAQLKTAQEVMS